MGHSLVRHFYFLHFQPKIEIHKVEKIKISIQFQCRKNEVIFASSIPLRSRVNSIQGRKFICGWLARLVRVKRPRRRSSNRKQYVGSEEVAVTSCLPESRTVTTILNEQCSHSLLANVLDLEDDVIRSRQKSSYCRWAVVRVVDFQVQSAGLIWPQKWFWHTMPYDETRLAGRIGCKTTWLALIVIDIRLLLLFVYMLYAEEILHVLI